MSPTPMLAAIALAFAGLAADPARSAADPTRSRFASWLKVQPEDISKVVAIDAPKGGWCTRALVGTRKGPSFEATSVVLEHCDAKRCTSELVSLGAAKTHGVVVRGIVDLDSPRDLDLDRLSAPAARVSNGALVVETIAEGLHLTRELWILPLRSKSSRAMFHGVLDSPSLRQTISASRGKAKSLDLVVHGEFQSGALAPGSGLTLPAGFDQRWQLRDGEYTTTDATPVCCPH